MRGAGNIAPPIVGISKASRGGWIMVRDQKREGEHWSVVIEKR